MRLIDADDLKVHISELMLVYSGTELDNAILNDIDNAPTVDFTFEETFQKTICENRLYCPARPTGEWEESFEHRGRLYHIEFLRVNTWIQKWFDIDYSEYTVKQGSYRHMPLKTKLKYIEQISGFKEMTVCEDESKAYEYWKHHFNTNPDDCCNLRK